MISEKESLLTKLNTLMTEFEVANSTISTLEQSLDSAVLSGISTDTPLAELTSASLHRESLRRVIHNIEENLIPDTDRRIELEEEAAREDILVMRQTLYDKAKIDILKKVGDILKIILSFDAECEKVETEAGLSAGLNQPIFYIQENDRLQFTD